MPQISTSQHVSAPLQYTLSNNFYVEIWPMLDSPYYYASPYMSIVRVSMLYEGIRHINL